MKKKPKRKHAHLHGWARIDRAGAALTARIELGSACDLLEVDADFGLNVLQQAYVVRAATRPSLTSFAALLSFHRGAELVDGLSVLLKAGCVVPMMPLVRSLLESVMYARYLMTVNDERIAACYLVSQQVARIESIEAHASEHADGSAPTILGRQARQHLEGMLAEERIFRDARNELARLSLSRSVPAPWYEAFDGPRTLGGMSGRLNDESLELVFKHRFDELSAATHASDTLRAMAPGMQDIENIEDLLRPLRSPTKQEITEMVLVSHDLFLALFTHHIAYFRELPAGLADYRALEEKLRAGIGAAHTS